MIPTEAQNTLNRLIDGQNIRVTTASGRVFEGIYDAAQSSLEAGLYFESMDGQPLRADWEKVDNIAFSSARAVLANNFMVPPEHPLSGHQQRLGPDGRPLKAYTTRNQ